ncbi:MAG: hypothetical protein WCF67_19060 [Chitinophagaceae bacterium]
MQRLNTLRIFVVLLIATTIFCSGASGHTTTGTAPASTATQLPDCDCQKPGTEDLSDDETPGIGSNIVVRMMKMY